MTPSLQEQHKSFNIVRSRMKTKGGFFTSVELLRAMLVEGVVLTPTDVATMVRNGLLDKFGNGKLTKYQWHPLVGHDGSEMNPCFNTFVRIFEDSKKRIKEIKHKSVKKVKDATPTLEEAIKICKAAGLNVTQTFKLATGEEKTFNL